MTRNCYDILAVDSGAFFIALARRKSAPVRLPWWRVALAWARTWLDELRGRGVVPAASPPNTTTTNAPAAADPWDTTRPFTMRIDDSRHGVKAVGISVSQQEPTRAAHSAPDGFLRAEPPKVARVLR